MRAISFLRYLLARSLFWVMGLRVGYWRRLVESAWSKDSRERYLESILKESSHKVTGGYSITTLPELQDAPIMNKEKFRQFASKPAGMAKFHRHTAGTSGAPVNVWLDRRELGRMLGVRDYCYRHCGIAVGDREGRLWGRPASGLKGGVKNFLLNRRVFNTSGQGLQQEVQQLIRWRPKYLYGYASLFLECAGELKRTGQTIPGLRCVIVTAEMILPNQKEYLSYIFNAPVHEEYGASEVDIIAFECRFGHRHLVNPWLIVETGNEEQALITDVSRITRGIVRYPLGDSVEVSQVECRELGDTFEISTLNGRTSDQFALTVNGEKFHAVEFGYAVDLYQREHEEVFQVTLVQDVLGKFKLWCDPEPTDGHVLLARYIEKSIKNKTGHKIEVKPDPIAGEGGIKKTYFIQKIK